MSQFTKEALRAMRAQIESRVPKNDRIPTLADLSRAVTATFDVMGHFDGRRESIISTGRYSEAGVHEALTKFVREDLRGNLANSQNMISRAKAELDHRRFAIKPKKPDPANAAAAVRRSELRALLRIKGFGEQIGMLLPITDTNAELVEAVLEAQPFELNLSPEAHASVVQAWTEKHHGPRLAEIDDLEEAIKVAETAVSVVRGHLASELSVEGKAAAELLGEAA